VNYFSTDLPFSLVGYLATINLQNDLGDRLKSLLDGRDFRGESEAAWSSLERERFDPAIRPYVEQGIAQNLKERVSEGRDLLKCFFLLLDTSGTVRYWVPPEQDLRQRLGPPFTYPAVMNGIVVNGEVKSPPLAELKLPPESLADSKGLGLAIAKHDIVYRSDFSEARSNPEFDGLAGFMSVLVIPVPAAEVPEIIGYPFETDVVGAVVLTSPVPSYFGPPDNTRGKEHLPRPRETVLREVLAAVRTLGASSIFALMRDALDTGRRERETLVLASSHGIPTRAEIAALALKEIVDDLGSRGFPDLASKAAAAAMHVRALRDQIVAAGDDVFQDAMSIRRKFRDVRLDEVLQGLVDIYRIYATAKGVQFTASIEVDHACMRASRSHLLIALSSLVENAIEAAEGDGGQVTTRATLKDGCGVLEIENTGEPIETSILDEFRRAIESGSARGKTTKGYGSGMGLLMAYRILHAHGVEFGPERYVRNAKTTTVTVILPAVIGP
jgi:signal transduction histidine kinase